MIFPFRDINPTRSTPVVTYALVAVNVLAYLWLSALPARQEQMVVLAYGFIPARVGQLIDPKPIIVEIPRRQFLTPEGVVVQADRFQFLPQPPQILLSVVTCMFLHGGWWHLIGNMWFLWIFGNNVEDRLGSAVYLAFYLGGGLAATAAQWLINPSSTSPVIGASGAVAAVLGAYAVTWPWARVESLVFLFVFITIIELPALFVLGLWFVGQLLEAMQVLNLPSNQLAYSSGVAWWAHVGGFVVGMVAMPPLSDLVRGGRRNGTDEPPEDDVAPDPEMFL
jgi:membrane associated rhomboid family serine protease